MLHIMRVMRRTLPHRASRSMRYQSRACIGLTGSIRSCTDHERLPSRCNSETGDQRMDDVLPGLRALLTTTPARWTSLTTTLPDDLLRREPAPGEWAAIDCLRHLRDAERDVFQFRLEAFRAGQDLVPYD